VELIVITRLLAHSLHSHLVTVELMTLLTIVSSVGLARVRVAMISWSSVVLSESRYGFILQQLHTPLLFFVVHRSLKQTIFLLSVYTRRFTML